MSSIIFSTFKTLVNIVVIILIGLAIRNILFQYEENRCVMTWMYSRPQYIKLDMNKTIQDDFPKYSLFIYGEADYAVYLEKMRTNFKLEGIPAVFVHGNAGRYKQVRSPGSVSLTKSRRKKFHFNYFSVDYEEELSALYGPYLERQTQFLHHVILRILQCYNHLEEEKRPSSVIAIGHSMGGMVIRGLYSIPTFDSSLLNVVINLATPQTKPPILLDEYIHSFYEKVNNIWVTESSRRLRNVTFLSLGGGFRDYLVRSELCFFDSISSNHRHFSSLTTALPNMWLENDHQCIVWCNQLVRALTRAFYNMIDEKTHQISIEPNVRTAVLLQTISFKNGEKKSFKGELQMCKKFDSKIHVILEEGCYRISPQNQFHVFNIWAFTERQNWLFICNSMDKCVSGDIQMFLPGNQMSQFHQVSRPEYFIIKAQHNERFLVKEMIKPSTVDVIVPYFIPIVKTFGLVNKPFYTITNLVGLTDPWQTYNVTISLNPTQNLHSTIVQIKPSWSNESNIYYFNPGEKIQFPLKLFTGNPTMNDSLHNHPVEIHIWREQMSRISIQIQPLVFDCMGQILRFNVEILIRYILIYHFLNSAVKNMNLVQHSGCYLMLRLAFHMALFTPRNFIHYGFIRIVLPEIFLLVSAYVIADVFEIIFHILLLLLSLVTYSPRRMLFLAMHKIFSLDESTDYYTRLVVNSTIVVALAYTYLYYGECFCLFFLMLIHLKSIVLSTENTINIDTLRIVLPVILLFIAVPIIVHTNDILNGFDHQLSTFTNLNILTLAYSTFLLIVKDKANDGKVSGSLFPVIILLFMFEEFIDFYNITYLLIIYFIFKINSHTKL